MEIKGKKTRREGFLEEAGLVQGQKKLGALGQGGGTLSHCTGQTQSLAGSLQQEDPK